MAGSAAQVPGVDPLSLILGTGAGLAGGIASGIAGINNQNRQAQQAQQQQQLSRDTTNAGIAAQEATLDPFRQQMAQGGDIAKLYQEANARFTPVHLTPSGPYAYAVPQMSGGFSYQKSPDVIAAANALKRNVEGGNVAPSMADPTNYGKTGTLNLLQIAADGKDPGTVNGSGGAPSNPTNYLTGVQTRTAGGIGTAQTRGTDVSVSNATQVLDKAIRQYLGRAPNPGEIQAMLAGQGLKPGDQWVGNSGLMGLLNTLQTSGAGSSAALTPSYSGRG